MTTLSILTAKILALLYISAGVAALRGKSSYGKIVDDLERSPALTFVTGFIALVFGAVLTAYHNLWVKDWRVLVTVVGWLSLAKGVLLIASPGTIAQFKGWYKDTQAWGTVMIALGLVFGYFGFLR